MLGDASIVQRNSGSTAGTPSTVFNFGFNAPVRPDTWSVMVMAHDVSNLGVPDISGNNFAAWVELEESAAAVSVANCPYVFVLGAGMHFSLAPDWGGDTTWTATYPGSARSVAWMAFEVGGLLPFQTAVDVAVRLSQVAGGGAATSIVLDATAVTSLRPDPFPASRTDQYDYAAFASRVASGTPPTVTGVAPTTSQPGTWVESMPSVATTNAAGANVRLDMWHKSQEDSPGFIDATATYSGASFLAALVGALAAQPVVGSVGGITVV
jgi:hypothetical protein